MSKRSLFWGNASGKLGETVQYRAGGEQRARTYVKKIKNPRTLAQMEQRITMGNLNSVFRNISVVVRESFPARKANQSGWNAFVQANANVVKSAVGKMDVEAMGSAPLNLVVAKGDIPISTSLVAGTYWDRNNPIDGATYQMQGLASLIGDVTVVDGESYDALSTGGKLYDYMTAGGNPYNLPVEFKVTVLWGYKGAIVAGDECWGLNVAQIIAKQGSTEGFKSLAFVNDTASGIYLSPNTMGTAEVGDTSTIHRGSKGLQLNIKDEIFSQEYGVFGFIVSWTENGKIRCTNSRIQRDLQKTDDDPVFARYQKGGERWNEILAEYGYSPEAVLGTK